MARSCVNFVYILHYIRKMCNTSNLRFQQIYEVLVQNTFRFKSLTKKSKWIRQNLLKKVVPESLTKLWDMLKNLSETMPLKANEFTLTRLPQSKYTRTHTADKQFCTFRCLWMISQGILP